MSKKIKGYTDLEVMERVLREVGYKFDSLTIDPEEMKEDPTNLRPHHLKFVNPENFNTHCTSDGKVSLIGYSKDMKTFNKFTVIGWKPSFGFVIAD